MKIFTLIEDEIVDLIRVNNLAVKSRKREFIAARTVFYLKLRPYTTYEKLGSLFGKDHTTVMYAIDAYHFENRKKWVEFQLASSTFDPLIDNIFYRYGVKKLDQMHDENKRYDALAHLGIFKKTTDPNINEISSLRLLEQQIAKKLQNEKH